MEQEFETKILDIDVDKILDKLASLGAKKINEKNFKRYVYDFNPKKENSWIRLRTDGQVTTLTVKEIENDEIEGTKELEIAVSDFDKTNLLLEKFGFKPKGYQENKRISYELDSVEVEIDYWPKIPAYLEIEGRSKKEVETIVRKLGFDLSQTTSANTIKIYKKYGIDLESITDLKF